ncbi:SpoIVB peptidase S55 domain-containing protein [Terrisporobacter petrolearius]|uniref:SpoIVB peptidase S55 domain-containing protein n=1 Tax=Terrisporobacter petrolearius TaxID=1460447 RepID=UPI0031CC6CA9
MGNILQIDAQLKNIIVRNEINSCPLKIGDSILKVEDNDINSYEDFNYVISSLTKTNDVSVLIRRENSVFCLKCDKNALEKINFNNLISGFATLTYINPETKEFGAVAHSINIGTTKKIPIKKGCISFTDNLNIRKSSKGNVGCINATKNNVIGEFNDNTTFGIKGSVDNIDLSNHKKYRVAEVDEVKLGKAQIILQNKSNTCKKYNIEIINIEKQRKPDSKGIKIKITDPQLLKETGGIVQGMSGTPIVQGNKIVGAVSHALENNPTVGYGVYIKWMLEESH